MKRLAIVLSATVIAGLALAQQNVFAPAPGGGAQSIPASLSAGGLLDAGSNPTGVTIANDGAAVSLVCSVSTLAPTNATGTIAIEVSDDGLSWSVPTGADAGFSALDGGSASVAIQCDPCPYVYARAIVLPTADGGAASCAAAVVGPAR
ncbi:MAG: hypothetical protein ACYDCP_07050 [Thermoplasmataceae archaeon]